MWWCISRLEDFLITFGAGVERTMSFIGELKITIYRSAAFSHLMIFALRTITCCVIVCNVLNIPSETDYELIDVRCQL